MRIKPRRPKRLPKASKKWEPRFVLLRRGLFEGEQRPSWMLLGVYETRISTQNSGRVWRERVRERKGPDAQLSRPRQNMKGELPQNSIMTVDTVKKLHACKVFDDPIEKWANDGSLTSLQIQTIKRVKMALGQVDSKSSVARCYSERAEIPESLDLGIANQECILLDPQQALRDIEEEFEGLSAYYSLFEKICRLEQGIFDDIEQRNRALKIVRFVADVIEMKKLI